MVRMRVLGAVLGCALIGGCGTSAVATAPPPAAPTATSAPAPAQPPPGTIALTGNLKAPGQLTAEQLAALPQQTAEVGFESGQGAQKHTEVGPALSDVIPVAALATTDRKNDLLSFAVLAVGADGYSAAVAYADASADFGNRGLLIALTEDGAALPRPRLIVPGDVKGGRYVSDLVELRVIRLG